MIENFLMRQKQAAQEAAENEMYETCDMGGGSSFELVANGGTNQS